MMSWPMTYLLIALVAGVLGFATLSGQPAAVAKITYLAFLVAFVISLATAQPPRVTVRVGSRKQRRIDHDD